MVGVVGKPASYIARAASVDGCPVLAAGGPRVAGSLLRLWLLARYLPSCPHLGFPGGVGTVRRGDRVSRAHPPAGLAGLCVPCLFRALSSSSGQGLVQKGGSRDPTR